MSELLSLCQEYAQLWQDNSKPGYGHNKRAVERRDWIAIDQDNGPDSWSGVVLVRKSDGQVFGIKGYGRPNLRRPRGHISGWVKKEREVAAARSGRETEPRAEGVAWYGNRQLTGTVKDQVYAAIEAEPSICEYCDAGDPASVIPYHKPEQCPSRPEPPGKAFWGMTAKARELVILLDGVDVAAHALGATPHQPEEAWLAAKAELWQARKALIGALRDAKEADLRTLESE